MNPTDNPQGAIQILLVDDQRLFRQSLKLLLEHDPDIQVVGESQDGQEAVVLATELRPDIVLLDVELPGLPGPKAARLIHERMPDMKILMLSVHDDDSRIRESLSAGASGYILKDADHREFIRIIKKTTAGEEISSPFLVSPDLHGPSPLTTLTAREREILTHLSGAMGNKEIASKVGLSPLTVKSHLQRIYAKLGVRTRAEALRLFYDQLKK
jgi:DNA-binding NarL/FixJ family response regulator